MYAVRQEQVDSGVRFPGPDVECPPDDVADVHTQLTPVTSLKDQGRVVQVACGNEFSVVLVQEPGGCSTGDAVFVFGSNLVGQVCAGVADLTWYCMQKMAARLH